MAGLPIPGPGRDSAYQPEYADQARKLCLLGCTDEELASFFGVHVRTIHRWKDEFPAFCHSINEGKVIADAQVADSLYRRATGEEVIVEKAVKNADGSYEAMRLKQFIPGDVTAQRLWLLNRRRENWRDKQDIEHSGYIAEATKEQRDAAVAAATRADQ
jgi:hypothetical protein